MIDDKKILERIYGVNLHNSIFNSLSKAGHQIIKHTKHVHVKDVSNVETYQHCIIYNNNLNNSIFDFLSNAENKINTHSSIHKNDMDKKIKSMLFN